MRPERVNRRIATPSIRYGPSNWDSRHDSGSDGYDRWRPLAFRLACGVGSLARMHATVLTGKAIAPFDVARLRGVVRPSEIAANTGTQIYRILLMLLNAGGALLQAPTTKSLASNGMERVGLVRGNR